MTTPAQTTMGDAAAGGNRLKALEALGQSVWLDYIRRKLITTGELKRMVDEEGLSGVTSNPSIFEKAISGSTDYADFIAQLEAQRDEAEHSLSAAEIFEALAVRDIQDAADILRPVYDRTQRHDGYISMEVSPLLAHDTEGTVAEARRLWKEVGRENVMIKVPGTVEGVPAIEQLISEGININVTLLFAQEAYENVAEAFLAGLEKRASSGNDVSRVASVASFFVSRIDTLADKLIGEKIKATSDNQQQANLKGLLGKVAIANARLAYQFYKEEFSGSRWEKLRAKGAQTQRLLWASTSTKNPAYRDVLYVEELIGADTVDTMPPATIDAFKDHGNAALTIDKDIPGAKATLENLERAGISLKQITAQVLDEGVKLFADAFEQLLEAIGKNRTRPVPPQVHRQTQSLSAEMEGAVKSMVDDWTMSGKVRKLWARDASLWTGTDEGQWLGWLDIVDKQIANAEQFKSLAEQIKKGGFTHALLLGMGGSSLCPEVMKLTFGHIEGFPEMFVLDSTDPAQIRAIEKKLDLSKTVFIVSSKSGTTLEPNIFHQYFYERAKQALGGKDPGDRFIAVTDPGSQLEQVAKSQHFRQVAMGVPSIGGRYSALSNFGMIPAAIQGIDVKHFLDRASEMVHACDASVLADGNPGVQLGAVLGVLAKHGRDKVTLITSPGISDLGAWLEQLLAESTGKQGKGLIPVDRETLGAPSVYGNDRVFVYLRLNDAPAAAQDAAIEELEKAGQPVVQIPVNDICDLGQEFFRWEMATAVAGSILGINAFNQPDVEASKNETRKLTSEYEKAGALPAEKPIFEGGGVKLFADPQNAENLQRDVGDSPSLAGYLRSHLSRLEGGDYFAVLGYIEMNDAHERALQTIRLAVRDAKKVATCLGFGPRFLHSTGQAYKGGPNTGVFLQITCDDAADIPVPRQKYTFGVVKAAQARGDFQILAERGRRALRVHLGKDVAAGLTALLSAVKEALRAD
ncbi:MAG TPA: bifunctional transaldolase/phosoglucose isomerase [Candidatus Acidoferrales bacterium]|nr:bifunctional transaldolase/phosoglucose isomerase [Candidatus Acidoferrales bacterium]